MELFYAVKNIQVIDGAENCTFSIFQATNEEFLQIFPGEGQDIEFAEDLGSRLGDDAAGRLMMPIWQRPIIKQNALGINGTLFYQFEHRRPHFPASKREKDWQLSLINEAQRKLYRE